MRGHIEKRGKNSYSIAVSIGKDGEHGQVQVPVGKHQGD